MTVVLIFAYAIAFSLDSSLLTAMLTMFSTVLSFLLSLVILISQGLIIDSIVDDWSCCAGSPCSCIQNSLHVLHTTVLLPSHTVCTVPSALNRKLLKAFVPCVSKLSFLLYFMLLSLGLHNSLILFIDVLPLVQTSPSFHIKPAGTYLPF